MSEVRVDELKRKLLEIQAEISRKRRQITLLEQNLFHVEFVERHLVRKLGLDQEQAQEVSSGV